MSIIHPGHSMNDQSAAQDRAVGNLGESILDFCSVARTKREISDHLGYRNLTYFTRRFFKPLLASGRLRMTIPEKPNSKYQKYYRAG